MSSSHEWSFACQSAVLVLEMLSAVGGGALADEGRSPMPIYVSPLGNDAWSGHLPAPNDGKTDGPFRTLKEACEALQPGQTCFLRQGTYRETLKPVRSGHPGQPLVISNYPGEVAVISGADPLVNWISKDGRIYQAAMDWDLEDQNQLFTGGRMLPEARWPKDNGLLLQPLRATAESGTATTLTDPQLPGKDDDWKGAVLWCAGGEKWICWSARVLGYDAASHTLSFVMSDADKARWYPAKAGSPYVVIGARSALEASGEWWYDRDARQVLLIPPEGVDLQTAVIEAKRRQHCIDLSGLSHVQIIGLHFTGGGVLTDENTNNILLSGCRGEYVAHSYLQDIGTNSGVLIRGHDNEVNSCEFRWSSTSVLNVQGTGHRIINCYLHHGNYGGKWTGAVALSGRRILFSHNTASHSGRDMITIHGLMEGLIQHNDISDAGWITRDLGLTYGHNTDFMNTVIRYNRVHDNHAVGCAMGIYLDPCSHNAIVHHNVVYNASFDPIQVNNPSYFNLILNNSCYASGRVETFDHSNRNDMFGTRFANNIFNREIKLPSNVVLENNLLVGDPGYEDPARGRFTLKADSPARKANVGAFPPGQQSWRTGHDFAHPPRVAWEPAQVDWMNAIHNSCFELPTLEGWDATGEISLAPGNEWGNTVLGSATNENTGTSKQELRLGKGGRAEQLIVGLHPNTAHSLSGWLRVSDEEESVRLGIRDAQGQLHWSQEVRSTAWTRVVVEFSTGAASTPVAVVVEKTSPGDGFAYCDNLGLPRAAANPG